jgi:beta-glucanase (GH16 family)
MTRRVRALRLRGLLIGLPAVLAACSSASAVSTPPRSGGTDPGRSTTQVALQAPASAGTGKWKLTWSSDFGKPGALKKKWLFYSGGTGFGLHQLQWYDAGNATVDKAGQLVITADRGGAGHTCWYGPCQYTSARMETINTFSQKYGEFEARIKFAPGAGLWPAFWIEGANVYKVGWPACGEVDIVEPNGKNANLVLAYAHSRRTNHHASLTVPEPITAGFHTYSVIWTPKGITWYFDGFPYSHLDAYKGWEFNHPFFIILDLAVGGGYSGPPNSKTPFPAKVVVDWVRVYRQVSQRR